MGDFMRILIVEDEYNLADVIASRLRKEKYIVDIANDGINGFHLAFNGVYNLIILDIMLPRMNGFQILKEIRENNLDVKVILLTAKTQLEDKLNGFDIGADDYITKPFHMEELVARVHVQLRKNGTLKIHDYLEAGDLRLNLKTSNLMCTSTNESIDIGCKEFLLLEYFMQNINTIISKEQIYNRIWGIDNEIESNNLEVYLSFIRKKMKLIGSNISIKAIRGLGYKLEVDYEKVKE